MKESERTLLFALAELRRGNCAWDAFQAAIKAAYADQQTAEPKPSGGVSEEISLRARNAFYDALSGWNLGTKMEAMDAFTSAVPYITAAKDAELAAVIRDNDAKMAEIERLKAEVKFLKDDAGGYLKVLLDTQRLAIERGRELEAIRNPDIDAAADAGLAAFHRTHADSRMQWRAIARAILKR